MQIQERNNEFSGQQGPESFIIGAKDVPNANSGTKDEFSGQQGPVSLIIGGPKA